MVGDQGNRGSAASFINGPDVFVSQADWVWRVRAINCMEDAMKGVQLPGRSGSKIVSTLSERHLRECNDPKGYSKETNHLTKVGT